ncbi:MAG: UvrD-helicase domain-containing protein [bacterium]|nr:UvrD-helicase domain-containing protein [bacterium]
MSNVQKRKGKKGNSLFFSWEKDLNPEQQKAVENIDGPVLVLAGAGSGKTRVVTYRIAYLIACGAASADKILALTFTNKAASEMRQRVLGLLHSKDMKVWLGTFHSIFARILRREARKIGYTSHYSIYDVDDQQKALKDIIKNRNLNIGDYSHQQIINQISSLKSRLITPEVYDEMDTDILKKDIILPVYREYRDYLLRSNAMDFDDLLVNVYLLFKNNPDVLALYQKRFKHVLVDEFQDTNFAQYQILLQLASKHHNICAVGDDDQSIYRWRGAEIKNILHFEHDFHDTTIIRLEQNYRSTKNILKAANSIIENNRFRHGKNLWTNRDVGEKITVNCVDTDREESGYVAQNILAEVSRENRNWDDFAVLYRLNAHSRLIEDNLRSNSIPYTVVGGFKFYDRKEVKDVLAYLKVIVNQDDTVNVKRILNYPPRGLGKQTFIKLDEYSLKNDMAFFQALKEVGEVSGIPSKRKEIIKDFKSLITKYKKLRNKISLVELVSTLIEEIQLFNQLKAEYDSSSDDRINNVKELVRSIEEYSSENPDSTLEDYVTQIALITDMDDWDKTQPRVSLMTVHSAKGLEFPVVFITGLEDGVFPLSSAFEDPEALEEERRLMYVATTRAEDVLYLTHSRTRWKYDSMMQCVPSRFLKEIDKSTILGPGYEPSISFYSPEKKASHASSQSVPSNSRYSPGQRISHSDFGIGMIQVVEGSGNKTKLKILFEGGIMKKLLAQYASLTILDD